MQSPLNQKLGRTTRTKKVPLRRLPSTWLKRIARGRSHGEGAKPADDDLLECQHLLRPPRLQPRVQSKNFSRHHAHTPPVDECGALPQCPPLSLSAPLRPVCTFPLVRQPLMKYLWRAEYLQCPESCDLSVKWSDCRCSLNAEAVAGQKPSEASCRTLLPGCAPVWEEPSWWLVPRRGRENEMK